MYPGYGIWHEVYDWNTRDDSRSSTAYAVKAGDELSASVSYVERTRSYDMFFSSPEGTISYNYPLSAKQTDAETVAYIVVEHQPYSCRELPRGNGITFHDIHVEVDGELVDGSAWEAKQSVPACDSEAVVIDSQTVALTWDTSSNDAVTMKQAERS